MKREYPRGVYKIYNGKFQAIYWISPSRELTYVGTYETWEEAHYRRRMAKDGNHWGIRDSEDWFGFVYEITNRKTGKKYIGKKQFYFWSGPVGGFKCTDPSDEWWDPKAWVESDWSTYTGSSQELKDDIAKGNPWDFTYEIVELCRDKLDLHIAEVLLQKKLDVLEATDAKGDYLYYNKNIASMVFRAPFVKADLEEKRSVTDEEIRKYYLKPLICAACSNVIPFGHAKCACGNEVIPVKVVFG